MPDAFARLLRRLLEEGSIPFSQVSARTMKEFQSLIDAEALIKSRSGGGLVLEVRSPQTVEAFYQRRYPSDSSLVAGPPRAQAVGMLRNAKRVGRTGQEPVLLRAMNPIPCSREGVEIDLHTATAQGGAACLILEPGRFWTLDAHVAVVENLECFLHFEQMGIAADVALYAAGRLSDLKLSWIASPELSRCRFTHCGDYDPVGLDECLRVKAVVGDRARLHTPGNLTSLISKYGRPELLRDSKAVLGRLRQTHDAEVQAVLKTLDKTCCGLEQEVLLLGL